MEFPRGLPWNRWNRRKKGRKLDAFKEPIKKILKNMGNWACFPEGTNQFLRLMAKSLTKSQIISAVAETTGLTKKQVAATLEATVHLAYKNAKNSFTLPGLGKLVLVNRKARMGRNPATGEAIKIAAKRVVKFRVAKAAKDAILGAKK